MIQPKKEIEKIQEDLKQLRKKINVIKNTLLQELDEIVGNLSEEKSRDLCLELFYDEICVLFTVYLETLQRQLIKIIQKLWDKYSFTINNLIENRNDAETKNSKNLSYLGLNCIK